jgi:hypothetical protein
MNSAIAILVLIGATLFVIAVGVAHDNHENRIDKLERQVACLTLIENLPENTTSPACLDELGILPSMNYP